MGATLLPAAPNLRSYAARRSIDPEVTLARIQPMLRAMGVTRIANITGLDHVGVPVVNVVRPNSRSNAVFQGKGLDLASAKTSGVMEAIESFCAEQIQAPLKQASAAEMTCHHALPELTELPRPVGSRFDTTTRIPWIEGREIATDEAIWVPFELVHANFALPRPPGSGNFLLSTNGLASGNHLDEAVCHGLYELIERDAGALFLHSPRAVHERRLDLGSIDDPVCRDIVDRLRGADLAVAIWDITSNVGLAAIHCRIMSRPMDAETIAYPAFGEACHSRRAAALLRAVIEAAQSRLAAIAGARDDIGADLYRGALDRESLHSWWRTYARNTGRRPFSAAPDQPFENTQDEIRGILAKLRHVGLSQAIMVDLTPLNCEAFAVARVIVPGLEPLAEAGCLPGRRARAVLRTET